MSAYEIVKRMQGIAEADAAGDPVAHIKLLEEIHNLRLAVETPVEKMMRMRFQFLQNLCIRVAIEYGIFGAVSSRKGEPITAAELAQETGADELLIIRIMRLVTYVGHCEEVDYATYAANETTLLITQKGFVGGEKHFSDLGIPVAGKVVPMIRDQGIHQFPDTPVQKNPFEYTFGKPIFEYFQDDKEQKEAFDNYMTIRRDPNAPQWFDAYPVEDSLGAGLKSGPEDVLLVDVGGGKGHEISKFQKRFPQLPGRRILQDLPQTIRAIEPKLPNIEFMEHDFFNKQPIKGARIYYLRAVMHDWSDSKCKVILSRIVEAMDKDYSRILIDDYVLPNTKAGWRAASMDILMMLFASGIERTQRQWDQLLTSVNLEIVNVWQAKAGSESIIEAKIRS